MNSPRQLLRVVIAAVILPLSLSACWYGQPHQSSKESDFLQKQLVPTLYRWRETNFTALHLYRSPTLRAFDHVCLVPEYTDLSEIRSELPQVSNYLGGIRDPFSNYEYGVPEMKIAIIGVKGDTAHVAYVDMGRWDLWSASKRCHRADKAMLVRRYRGRAKLQELPGE